MVGGEVQLFDESEPHKATFIIDSTIGGVAAVYIKQDQQWRRLSEPLEWMRPYVSFAALGNSARDEDIH